MVTGTLNHRIQSSLNVAENPRDLIQTSFDCVETRRRGFAASVERRIWHRRLAALEHNIKVLWLPAKCYRQRFQSSRTTAALNGLALNLPHNRDRHMRAFGKLTLTPSKFSHALIDGLSDRSPILRHSIPPRSTFGAEVSGSSRFRGTPRGPDSRNQANRRARKAEIIDRSLKSAHMLVTASSFRGHGRNDK